MTGIQIDWKAIRPLNGGKDKGFEELCAQLARVERPSDSAFVRKAPPDAGLECYAILTDGSEWGWQAKYFHALGDAQWPQIDESVKTAIEKHPKLSRYFICVPVDRADPRSDRKEFAKDRWDNHVEKWTKWVSEKEMTVEFVYWGSHELLERLTRPQHVGRVRFWFGIQGMDSEWFAGRLDEAVRSAGPRYTPEVHVDLPIAWEFEAFGRTERFFDRLKSHARMIRKVLHNLEYDSPKTPDSDLAAATSTLMDAVQAVFTSISELAVQPTETLPFSNILEHNRIAEEATEDLLRLLVDREREQDAVAKAEASASAETITAAFRDNNYGKCRHNLQNLSIELEKAKEALSHADKTTGRRLMILRGIAGTGKTHLLCDVARQRVASGRPTVLLMGQGFVSNEAPWSQALQQLDLASLSAEEFVGALESAAQAADSRALLIIDAINEGTGRTIWPVNLAAFLAKLERSPWIAVVLAVRSSYEDIIVPFEIRSNAIVVTHQGFMNHEYNAMRTFFLHYDLELPSTPLLAPEFQIPLFLKALCTGLKANNERRLPRGLHGITAVFDLHLRHVNKSLASSLGFDSRTPLVWQALEAVSNALLDSGETWLMLTKAKDIVDAFHPGREYEKSLYRGLVVEGILVEEARQRHNTCGGEVVYVGYERLADHLTAKTLLGRHLDISNPASAFAFGGSLAHFCDDKNYVSPGLLEALCIQIPELTGQELVAIAPACAVRWGLGDAFRQSLIWRSLGAFTDDTKKLLGRLCHSEHDMQDTLDMLLTVATLPGHPLNALYLDSWLRKKTMCDRDALWSVYLHHAWGNHGAVDRLVDWASSITPETSIDDESVDLCAITLTWMLTSSNRFLRDCATKALVSLLTGRLSGMSRLVERFSDVDDPYVMERVYAVAYGVSMRCHDSVAVGTLASIVYRRIFASGSPPPHILLRDYARGVVERAIHLGSEIDVVSGLIRPPYKSTWPSIPTEEEIKPLLPDWSKGSHDSGEFDWGFNIIGNSVMQGDFARYVIGTNSSPTSSDWLSLRLDEPSWKSPPRPEDLQASWVATLSAKEQKAWNAFKEADEAYSAACRTLLDDILSPREKDIVPDGHDRFDLDAIAAVIETASPPIAEDLKKNRTLAFEALRAALTAEHAQQLREILTVKDSSYEARRPPRFDLRQIQRYILKRVFEMGWTKERFGCFDRFSVGHSGRDASKAERIGKKYQWIAYHEIQAFISDHFQRREQFQEEEGDKAYVGPWQDDLRDIDPSCTLKSVPGGTSWGGHADSWWGSAQYKFWGDPINSREWVQSCDDLPNVVDLLFATCPVNKARWVNGKSYFNWKQQPNADLEATDVMRRELWYICTGYLLRAEDSKAFLKWAEGINHWGRWMPDVANIRQMFFGEHEWAPASRYYEKLYESENGWTKPNHGCPIKVSPVALEYRCESSGLDCSVEDNIELRVPSPGLMRGLGLKWSGKYADYINSSGQLAVMDPTAHAKGPSALLFREELLRDFLAHEKLTICWSVLGAKQILDSSYSSAPPSPTLQICGAYILADSMPVGFLKYSINDPAGNTKSSIPLRIIHTGTLPA